LGYYTKHVLIGKNAITMTSFSFIISTDICALHMDLISFYSAGVYQSLNMLEVGRGYPIEHVKYFETQRPPLFFAHTP
jgi:hypothetical protein